MRNSPASPVVFPYDAVRAPTGEPGVRGAAASVAHEGGTKCHRTTARLPRRSPA